MKKAFVFAGLAAATLSFVGCNKEADFARNSRKVEIVLSDIDTRTVNNGMETEWNAGDELSVFNAPAGTSTWSSNIKFTVQDASANRATGEVELTADAYDWYAFYPYTSKIPNPTTLNPEGSTYERSGYSTVGGQFQTQKMDDNKEHLAGVKVPVFGNVKNVPAGETPVIEMKNAASVVRFKVVNAQEEAIKVLSVKFTAPEDIVGTYYIDFSDATPAFVGSGDTYVFDNVMVTNADPSAIAPDSNADYYAVIKPFTAAAGAKLKVEVEAENADGSKKGTTTKEITLSAATEFKPGYIKLLNIPFDVTMTNVTAKEIPYTQSFADGAGDFTIDNVIGSGIWTPATANGQNCMKGTSHFTTNVEGESWLISPEIDGATATNGVKLSFKQCINKYFGDVTKEATLWAREKGGEWKQFTITYPALNGNWSAFEEQVVDLSEFKGKTFQFAFKYVGHAATAGTWEVCNVAVTDAVITPEFNAELPGADESLSLTVPATTTSVTINVTGNVAWAASASDGATVAPASGEGAGTVTVSFPANTDPAPKDYTVVVSTDNAAIISAGGDEYVFTITQEAASGELTATIDFSEQEYANGEEVVTATADGVTFTFDKGTNSTAPKYYNTGTAVRMYGSNTLTVAAAGKTITSIVFTFGSGDGTNSITASVPTYEEPAWTGEAGSVTFTIGGTTGQRRIKAITVKYLDSGSPAASLVSIAVSGQKTEFNVGDEFTHDTAKVTATYSDDTTKDVTASATFSAPDMATAGTKEVTVSYTEGVTKTTSYNITVSAPTTLTVSQSVALADDATGIVGDAIVAAISTKGFIATDGTQNVYVYLNKQPEVALGDKVGFSFKKTTFFGLPELTNIANLTVASHGNTIPRTELKDITATIDTYNSSETDYLTVTGTLEKSGSYYNVTVSGATKYASPMYLYGIDPSALVDQQVVMTGYFNTINSSKGAVQFIATEIKAADANVKYCVVDPEVLNVNATATSATLTIQANAAWTVTSDNSAFTVSPASGSTDKTVTITFAANETQTAKVANITVACPDASVNKTIVLTQAAAVPQGDGYTIVFGNNSNSTASIAETTKASTVISSGTEYVTDKPFTVNTGKAYYGDTKDCIRIGKTGEASKLTIALSSEGQVAATSIVVNCRRAVGNKNANAMLTVNGVGPLAPAANDAAAASDVVFTLSSSENLESIVLEGTAAIYIYSITVNK